jgi:hypothetical protein
LFNIEFYLEKTDSRWSAEIHQLNSDILQRHILPKLQSNLYSIHFDFCEKSMKGDILSNDGFKLGTFEVN